MPRFVYYKRKPVDREALARLVAELDRHDGAMNRLVPAALEGNKPEVVARVMGFGRSSFYRRLALARERGVGWVSRGS
jgi:hypothetical protein